jgi:iron complex outermembrane receptor protein
MVDNNQDIFHNNRNENYGAFASIDYSGIESLTLRAGVRYSHDKRHDVVSGFGPNLFGYVLPVQASVSGSAVTWDASATYAVTSEINLYARAATGYQGPAIQDRVNFGSRQTTAPKQTTISGEAGIKGAFPHGLNFAIDGYWYRTNDLQITAVGGSSNSARLLSADHAVGYGMEAEISVRPAPHFELTASGSYNFTEIRDPSISVGVCANCTVLDPIVGGRAVIDGNDLPQAPRWVGNFTARYGIPVGDDGEVYVFTDWAYRSSINYFLYDAKEFRGRSLLEGGLKVAYKSGDKWEVAAFARNITNQIRSISGIDFNNLTGMINDPRIIGGSARINF